MMKQTLLLTPLLLAITLVVFPANVQAQEIQSSEGLAEVEAAGEVFTEAERQVKLAEIAQQLQEVEREVTRLSLLVTKLALEEQAVALQQQVEEALARAEQGSLAEQPSGIAQVEPVQEPQEVVSVPLSEDEQGDERQEEDVLSRVVLEEQGEEREEKGFLGAFGPFQNLGTPELATVVILALLGAFLLVRRLREGSRKRQAPISQGPAQAEGFQASSERVQKTMDDSRQDLQEGVAWK